MSFEDEVGFPEDRSKFPSEPVRKKLPTDYTCSELLIEVLEKFGTSEPQKIVVVYCNEDNQIWLCTNARKIEVVGLLEIAKDVAINSGKKESV